MRLYITNNISVSLRTAYIIFFIAYSFQAYISFLVVRPLIQAIAFNILLFFIEIFDITTILSFEKKFFELRIKKNVK